jgi:hypothetical protein
VLLTQDVAVENYYLLNNCSVSKRVYFIKQYNS